MKAYDIAAACAVIFVTSRLLEVFARGPVFFPYKKMQTKKLEPSSVVALKRKMHRD